MEKIKVKSKLISNDEIHEVDGLGQLKDNRIIYYDNKVKVVIRTNENLSITRENDDYLISLNFVENEYTKSKYILKSTNAEVIINVFTKSIICEKNNIVVEYELTDEGSSNNYKYSLNYEVKK